MNNKLQRWYAPDVYTDDCVGCASVCLSSDVTKLEQQVETLTRDLNEARREICRGVRPYNPEDVAEKRKWKCFEGE